MSTRAIDDTRADDRVDFALARAEVASSQLNRLAAERMSAVVSVIREARRHPDTYVVVRDEATARDISFAVEAAIADLAVRLSLSESTVGALVRRGELVTTRALPVWNLFREGEISPENVACVADVLDSLPENEMCDARVADRAAELAGLVPSRFRERMRAFRDRVHPESQTERHERARAARRTWIEHGDDGMAWLGIHLPSTDAEAAWQRIDGIARQLATCTDESRSLDQIRADAVADILTGRNDPATEPRVTVGVLVPVLTLLGEGDQPATLEGRIPIDPETARRLAVKAPSFHRILTHPVSSAVLDVDRTSYRPPADLARVLALRDVTCRHPGCGRPAKRCDIDHTVDWAKGGTTSVRNLAHLSRRHHTLKHRTRWTVEQRPDGVIRWTSPTGFVADADPPPF
ncbi:DUF222 domain-containing protein [Pseudolysinimonas sp.]|jgi:hypothetical protein|uniref:HNH endonuclease signature motif containing protein n=1 Tax=Pseudolysinimonas sp. TaxID=2680009 RepID=UPI0037852335